MFEVIGSEFLGGLAATFGEEWGRRLAERLGGMLRRAAGRANGQDPEAETDLAETGEDQLETLTQDPGNVRAAEELNARLIQRCVLDAEFAAELRAWHTEAKRLVAHNVHNTISGGTFHAPVVQGHAVTQTFGVAPWNAPAPDGGHTR
ncbi:hypothetical protein [Streptomyces collinus]|uniref:hypothetical protein n=1 Tax=Streptomyces collinus TaxID=42684 RepID=UPI0033E78E35